MKNKRFSKSFISVALIFVMLFSTIVSSAEQLSNQTNSNTISEPEQDYKTDRFIIKYKSAKTSDNLLSKGGKHIKGVKKLKNKKFDVITTKNAFSKSELLSELKAENADDNIEYIVPDNQVQLSSDDTYFTSQWALGSVTQETYENAVDAGVVPAWSESQGEGTVVAVADTGMDITHEDIAGNIWVNNKEVAGNGKDDDGNGYIDDVNGWNFYDGNNKVHNQANASDEEHSTHIAGIIAAAKDNGKGVAGVAPKAKIMPLKIFSNGSAYTSDIIEAIDYAEKMGAKIVNCSWGTATENQALKEAIESKNMLFVCAAGNNGVNIDVNPVYPASYSSSNIITVASMDKNGYLAASSNYGENKVDVAAPGEGIISALPGNTYGQKSGTSMAAGFVSGEAAILLSKYAGSTPAELKSRIKGSSDMLTTLQGKVSSGNKLNCNKALSLTASEVQEKLQQEESVIEDVYNEQIEGSVIDSVYSDVYKFATFADGATYSARQSVTSSIFSLPTGSYTGQLNATVGGNTLTNAVKNGNFSNSSTDWGGDGNCTVSSNTLTYTYTGSSSTSYLTQVTNMSALAGKKVFVKALVRVTNASCSTLSFRLTGSTGGSYLTVATKATPTQNQWYVLSGVTTLTDQTGNLRVRLQHDYTDVATGKVMEVKEVTAIDMTAAGLESKTSDEMNALTANSFDGTKSTEGLRIKSVGKNLFDFTSFYKQTGSGTKNISDATVTFNTTGNSSSALHFAVYENSYNNGRLVTSSSSFYATGSTTTTITTSNSNYYDLVLGLNGNVQDSKFIYKLKLKPNTTYKATFKITTYGANSITVEKLIQIEESSTITYATRIYEPYQESIGYVNTKLNGLPNGVKDTIDLTSGVYTKNVQRIRPFTLDNISQ